MAYVDILGVEFYPVTLMGAVGAVEWMLSRNDGVTRLVVTANPIMIMNAQRDPEFRAILRGADLIVPDGIGLLWAARRLGKHLPERVTGVDMVEALLRRKPPLKVFLLGGQPGVSDRAKDAISGEYTGVEVVGTHHGYYEPSRESAIVDAIRASQADLLLVGMGSPKQEKLIWRNRLRLGARVAIGVGGVLDILSGKVSRSPTAFQRLGLEWLYRLAREPRRLKADMALAAFVMRVQVQAFRQRNKAHKGDERDDGDNTV
ncbi:MAG: WecB/TagA/CpsF family glycosyltransferase [Bacillota bacterium]